MAYHSLASELHSRPECSIEERALRKEMSLCPAVSPINPEQLEEAGLINRHAGPHVDPHYHCPGRVVPYHREQSPETRSIECSQPVHSILFKSLVSLSVHG